MCALGRLVPTFLSTTTAITININITGDPDAGMFNNPEWAPVTSNVERFLRKLYHRFRTTLRSAARKVLVTTTGLVCKENIANSKTCSIDFLVLIVLRD